MPEADERAPRALLLTAGLGTRLRPLTYVRAKAAVPINGEALVRRVIRGLAAAGIAELVLNLHHRPASIAALVGDGSDLGVSVRYSWEQPVLGSAGGPRRALPLLVDSDDETFLIVNGDTLTDVDIRALVARHRAVRGARHDGADSKPAPQPVPEASLSQRTGLSLGLRALRGNPRGISSGCRSRAGAHSHA